MPPAFTKDPLFRKGLKIRKEIVGADYVERRLAAADEHTWPFEEAATKFAFGSIWSRPGLPRKTRSLLNIAALTAMNLRHELKLHIGAGLRNGLTRREISEAILHCAVYCGFPKSLDALRLMREVYDEVDAAGGKTRRRRVILELEVEDEEATASDYPLPASAASEVAEPVAAMPAAETARPGGAALLGVIDLLTPDLRVPSAAGVAQARRNAVARTELAQEFGSAYNAARVWHRGPGLWQDAAGDNYEALIRRHVQELFG